MTYIPTQEEIDRVNRFTCSMNGHSLKSLETEESMFPVLLTCSRCGASADVVPREGS